MRAAKRRRAQPIRRLSPEEADLTETDRDDDDGGGDGDRDDGEGDDDGSDPKPARGSDDDDGDEEEEIRRAFAPAAETRVSRVPLDDRMRLLRMVAPPSSSSSSSSIDASDFLRRVPTETLRRALLHYANSPSVAVADFRSVTLACESAAAAASEAALREATRASTKTCAAPVNYDSGAHRLPLAIWSHVCTWCSVSAMWSVSAVSRQFRRVSQQPSSWAAVRLSEYGDWRDMRRFVHAFPAALRSATIVSVRDAATESFFGLGDLLRCMCRVAPPNDCEDGRTRGRQHATLPAAAAAVAVTARVSGDDDDDDGDGDGGKGDDGIFHARVAGRHEMDGVAGPKSASWRRRMAQEADDDENSAINGSLVSLALHANRVLRDLSLGAFRSPIDFVPSAFPNLVRLDLQYVHFGAATLFEMFARMPRLEVLRFHVYSIDASRGRFDTVDAETLHLEASVAACSQTVVSIPASLVSLEIVHKAADRWVTRTRTFPITWIRLAPSPLSPPSSSSSSASAAAYCVTAAAAAAATRLETLRLDDARVVRLWCDVPQPPVAFGDSSATNAQSLSVFAPLLRTVTLGAGVLDSRTRDADFVAYLPALERLTLNTVKGLNRGDDDGGDDGSGDDEDAGHLGADDGGDTGDGGGGGDARDAPPTPVVSATATTEAMRPRSGLRRLDVELYVHDPDPVRDIVRRFAVLAELRISTMIGPVDSLLLALAGCAALGAGHLRYVQLPLRPHEAFFGPPIVTIAAAAAAAAAQTATLDGIPDVLGRRSRRERRATRRVTETNPTTSGVASSVAAGGFEALTSSFQPPRCRVLAIRTESGRGRFETSAMIVLPVAPAPAVATSALATVATSDTASVAATAATAATAEHILVDVATRTPRKRDAPSVAGRVATLDVSVYLESLAEFARRNRHGCLIAFGPVAEAHRPAPVATASCLLVGSGANTGADAGLAQVCLCGAAERRWNDRNSGGGRGQTRRGGGGKKKGAAAATATLAGPMAADGCVFACSHYVDRELARLETSRRTQKRRQLRRD